MRRKLLCIMAALTLTMFVSNTAMAGEWKQNDIGYWYQEDDGTWPVNTWKEINGKWYYFNADGYMLAGIVTPDGYTLDGTGAWNQSIPKQEPKNVDYTIDPNTGKYVGPEGEKPGYEYIPGFGYIDMSNAGGVTEGTNGDANPDELSGNKIGYMG